MTEESPRLVARRLGLTTRVRRGHSTNVAISWDDLLDMAVEAYWQKRRDAAA